MDIPMIGNTASRELCRRFDGDLRSFEAAVDSRYDFTQLPDFGETLHRNIHEWFKDEENRILWEELQEIMNIERKTNTPAEVTGNPFVGLTVVVTGKVEPYTRNEINAKIEALGAHAGGSVSKNTNYLVCGENAGSKLDKARALGVPVLSPAEFFRMASEA
jgi:DNA ligase (NAD+)